MVRFPSRDRPIAPQARSALLALALLAIGAPRVLGQDGLSGGGPTGIGSGMSGPRGSAINGGSGGNSSSNGDPERFGGLGGGEGGRGGSIGSSSRSGLRTTPGDPDESRVGAPIGASGTVSGDNVPGNRAPRILGGRIGRSGSAAARPGRAFGVSQDNAARTRIDRDRRAIEPPDIDPISLARRPLLDLPDVALANDPGPADGLTLDAAIDLILRQNLDLIAQRYEIPKAEADLLTAGLRDNPIFYADTQLVPYGNFTKARPGGGGGQPQYDINVSIPLDLNNKRKGRVAVARLAKKVTEAQFQEAARNLIDDLYNAYLNVLAARDSLRFAEAYLGRIDRDLADAESADRELASKPDAKDDARKAATDAVLEIRSRERQARLQARQGGRQLARATDSLAQLLNLPAGRGDTLKLRGRLREEFAAPLPVDELVQKALACRPDVVAYRLGTARADADVRLARLNRYSDVYLVYQPYTFQSNHSFGAKGTYTYGLGLNAAVPLFNRNQGNIVRATANASQTRVELASLEQRASHEVRQTARDVELGLADVIELEREVIPASVASRDAAYQQYREDPSKIGDYVDEQADLNDVIRLYRDALIDLRQDMLDLNTAVGQRVLP